MAGEAEPRSEQEIITRFQELRQSISVSMSKLSTLNTDADEHDLVIKQLEPMDKSRKCYRLIGDVLVERTVAETLPAVKRNRENLEAAMKRMEQDIQQKQKTLAAFVTKYKIRTGGPGDDDEDAGRGGGGGSSSSKPQQSKQGSGPGAGGSSSSSSKGVLA